MTTMTATKAATVAPAVSRSVTGIVGSVKAAKLEVAAIAEPTTPGDDERALAGGHELADCTLCELAAGFGKVELERGVCEGDLDQRGQGPCISAAIVRAADDCSVFSLVADVHCVVRVVRSAEFADTALVGPDGHTVGGTALVLQVVAEEAET